MPRYLIQASYTAAAAAAFVSNPQDRVGGVKAIAENLGGTMISVDFCLGDYDVIVVAEMPDDDWLSTHQGTSRVTRQPNS
jgi:uncharacterized protein with GYD domain